VQIKGIKIVKGFFTNRSDTIARITIPKGASTFCLNFSKRIEYVPLSPAVLADGVLPLLIALSEIQLLLCPNPRKDPRIVAIDATGGT